MRIKKKDVILEASLLDVSTEFNKHEKNRVDLPFSIPGTI